MRGSIAARTLRSTVQAAGLVAVLLFGSSPAGFAQGVCGNGKIEPSEACDDGNLADGDGCSASCNVEQQCYDVGNTFSFFTWSDSYGSSGDDGVMTVMQDAVNVGAHPGRVAPRFWLATGDIPFMADGTQRLDEINDAISNSASGQRYPFQCSASNGKFPYFVAIGNHDVDGYGTMTPTAQYSYWKNVVGPKLPGTLVGIKNFRWGPSRADGADANTTYSFDYKNAHFVIVNQYHGDSTYPTDDPKGCIRADMMTWIDEDLAQTTRPIRFVFGHEPAWSYCTTQGGYGGAYCPVGSLDNLNPAFRARPYSTQGAWFEPYGGHWGDSLEDQSCPAGSREAFWALLARHDVIAHFNGHTHTYSGRLVKGDGTRRNDVHAYNKGGATFDSKDGVFGVDTGAVYNDGMSFVLTTVRDNLVTFESFDKLGNESMKLIETWSVRLGINPTVAITSPAAGATFVTPADITITAEAADLDGSVAQVAFYAGSTLLGVDTTSPYEVTWPGAAAGNYVLTAIATDDQGLATTSAPVSVTVTPPTSNHAPTLAPIGDQTLDELQALSLTAQGSDADATDTLTYSLVGGPTGSTIGAASGAFSWTPTEAQGPGSYRFTVRVKDNGSPALSADRTITVTVREINQAPVLAHIGNRSAAEGTALTIASSATDADLPANSLTYSLLGAPAGASIGATSGVLSWTPSETQGGSTYSLTLRVTDNGSPAQWAEETFDVVVAETNQTPVLASISNKTVPAGATLTFTASATDGDLPANQLTFSLSGAPAGASIHPTTGVFTWTTAPTDTGTRTFSVVVTDNATPPAAATRSVTVTLQAPIDLSVTALSTTTTTINPGSSLSASNSVRNLGGTAAGASVVGFHLSTDAVWGGADDIAFTQTRSINSLAASATSTASTSLTVPTSAPAGTYFLCAMADVNNSVGEGNEANNTLCTAATLQVTRPDLTTTQVDVSATTATAGGTLAVINSVRNQGLAAAGSSSVSFRFSTNTVVGDGDDVLSATTRTIASLAVAATSQVTTTVAVPASIPGGIYRVCVTADAQAAIAEADETNNSSCSATTVSIGVTNHAPTLAPIGASTVDELSSLAFVASGSDQDAGNALSYSLVGAPAGSSIGAASGAFAWTPTEAQGPGVFNFTVRVTDNGSPALFADQPVSVTVREVNQAPVLAPIGNRSATEAVLLTFAASSSDADLPANTLSYSLASAPAGAAVTSGGIFSWTPAPGQGNASVTLRVTDNGSPALFAEETFAVTVTAANHPPTLSPIAAQSVDELSGLTFGATGSDPDAGNTLSYSLVSGPAGSSIDPATGAFSWTPTEAQGPGVFAFTVRVTDNGSPALSADQPVSVTVREVNQAPLLAPIGNRSATEGLLLTFAASSSDADLPANTLTYALTSAPAGAAISTGGIFSWTPALGQGNANITVRVSDDGSPSRFAEETFAVTVAAGNHPPTLAPIPDQTVDELAALAFVAAGSDPDAGNTLSYSLVGGPAGSAIDPATGAFSWTPTEAQGPGVFPFTVRVTDNGSPALSADQPVSVTVGEVNLAPVLAPVGNRNATEGVLLTFGASASDADLPANTLTYSLPSAPAGAAITAGGVFSWTPAEGQGNASVTVRVTDNGSPVLFAEETFAVTVAAGNHPPTLAPIPDQTVDELAALGFVAAGSDPDAGNTLSYSLVGGPAGSAIDSGTGAFAWTPTEAQGPGVFPFTVRVTDNGSPALSADQPVSVTVGEVNLAPVLAPVGNRNATEGVLLTFGASASDADLPANTLTYSLTSAPAGAAITTGGVFSWTPAEGQGNASVTVRVTDNGSPVLFAEETFAVTVTAANHPPALAVIPPQAVDELAALAFVAAGSDPDAGNTLSYSLVGGPAGSAIDSGTGAFAWTPTEAQGPGVFPFTVRVTDNGSPALSADQPVSVTVRELNQAPLLVPIGNRNATEGVLLTFGASASDADLPANTLTYSLPSAPAGAAITAGGVFSWTPTESQGNASVTVRVTDNGSPVLFAEETFAIAVAETNQAPVLASISNKTVAAGGTLTFTASATDADLPANQLAFSLSGAPAAASINPTTGAFTWTTAITDTGTRTFSVVVTDNGVPPASAQTSVNVTVQGPTDLLVTALSTATTAVLPGSSLTASNSVKNQGSAAAGASVVGFHLSVDPVWGGADDVAFTQTRSLTSLAAAATSTANTSLTVPASTPLGAYYLCAMADVSNALAEGDEANNTRCTATPLQVTRPDLITTEVSPAATSAIAGNNLAVVNTARNQGALSASSTRVGFRFSTNPVVGDADDVTSNTTRTTGTLAAGASSQATTQVAVPNTIPAGTYLVCATADTQAAVVEADETNNSACSPTTVVIAAPDLTVSAVSTTTTTLKRGTNLNLANTVANQGATRAGSFVVGFHLSVDASFGGVDDVAITKTRTVNSLNAGATNAATTNNLTVPATTPAGSYYLCAFADTGASVVETDETNNGRCTGSTISVTP